MSEKTEHPMFVMSMYANREALYKAKAEYYETRCDELEIYEHLVDTIAQVNVTLMQKQKEFIKTIADLRVKLQLKGD
jgi:hypothetical protein